MVIWQTHLRRSKSRHVKLLVNLLWFAHRIVWGRVCIQVDLVGLTLYFVQSTHSQEQSQSGTGREMKDSQD